MSITPERLREMRGEMRVWTHQTVGHNGERWILKPAARCIDLLDFIDEIRKVLNSEHSDHVVREMVLEMVGAKE